MAGSFLTSDLVAVFNADHFAVVGELMRASTGEFERVYGIFDDEDLRRTQGKIGARRALCHGARLTGGGGVHLHARQ